MPIKFEDENEGKVLAIQVNGKLAKADYVYFAPEFERLIQLNGKLRVLLDLTGFHGWEAGALWEDIKVDFNTSPTSNGLPWSGIRSGSMAWRRSANPSRERQSDTSIASIPPKRGRGWTKRSRVFGNPSLGMGNRK